MAVFTVDANLKVKMRSYRDAAYPQHFSIKRQSPVDPNLWETMGKSFYDSGERADFVPFSHTVQWEIICHNYNTDSGVWVKSLEKPPEGVGTGIVTIYFDDDSGGDFDYNDTVVKLALGGDFPAGSLAGIVANPETPAPEFDGNGDYKPKPQVPSPHWTPRRKGDIEP